MIPYEWKNLKKEPKMPTGAELRARIKRRQAALRKEQKRSGRENHVTPCDSNFEYSSITRGSKEGLELVLAEMNGK